MAAQKSRYIPALDGMRAFAVLAVIAYHMGLSWAPGGTLGVTMFFVLSGYLITSLLLIEWDNTNTINLPQFWLRRVRRLYPALVLVIICTAALCTVFDHALLTKLRSDVWAALLWFTNWWYIIQDASYFEALGAPSPLTHYWSLAIEEQFYLIWPIVLLVAHKAGVSRNTMSKATGVLVLLSAVEMAILYDPTADPSRVYYGTDTRALSPLIGAWLAFIWPSNALSENSRVQLKGGSRVIDGVAIACFAALALMVVFVSAYSSFWYYGGILLTSILTMVVIAVIVHPASSLGKFFSLPVFVWIGQRSYGMYLWHFPLLLLMNPRNLIGETPWWALILQLLVIVAVAEVSYRLVENPIRHGALGELANRIRNKELTLPEWLLAHRIPTALATGLTLIAIGGLIFVPNTSALEGADLLKDESAQTAGIPSESQIEGAAAEEVVPLNPLLIGDSVSVRAIPAFQETFPEGGIDSAVSRQIWTGIDVYNYYADQGLVGDVVVFALGTNGLVVDEQVDDLMASVGPDKHVFLVNTRSPQSWCEDTNSALQRATDRYDNVRIIDWYGFSADKQDLFDGDGTHLTEEGAQVYVDLIHNAIKDLLPPPARNAEPSEMSAYYIQTAGSVAAAAIATHFDPIVVEA